ncbi:uncharacterized protein VTP21DRAFT_7233 [Calcarisporiella thermophila]|uniref:uncharacterized protein n=1 Tax=Calcarisporiella thermophila TaxID=911321 RepID=UPI0037427A87
MSSNVQGSHSLHESSHQYRHEGLEHRSYAYTLPLPPRSPATLSDGPKSPCLLHKAIDNAIPFPSTFFDDNVPVTPPDSDSFEYERDSSLMSKLAETANGVREAAKRLGRARIKWEQPRTVMIVTKTNDAGLIPLTRQLLEWLLEKGMTVYVEEKLRDARKFKYRQLVKTSKFADNIKFWTPDLCARSPHMFDFIITLGGDGTVLYTSWLFQHIVPPVFPFNLGSLGFLTSFNFSHHREHITTAIDKGVRIHLRMRFSCTVYRARRLVDIMPEHAAPDAENSAGKQKRKKKKRLEEEAIEHFPVESFEVLNDLVVDRGPSPYMSLMELFGDEKHLTTVQADGLAVSTPTGSTAYSLAAGGPLTHPEIPAFLITPLCPHTLSFRPMLLPDSMELRVQVPLTSRSTAWASFDGRGRIELKQGDYIKITASQFPFPTICATSQSEDWFESLTRCLNWNQRQRQKAFPEDSDDDEDEELSESEYSDNDHLDERERIEEKLRGVDIH